MRALANIFNPAAERDFGARTGRAPLCATLYTAFDSEAPIAPQRPVQRAPRGRLTPMAASPSTCPALAAGFPVACRRHNSGATPMSGKTDLTFSHAELRVRDLAAMESFFTDVLGFLVTDRGETMVFLSRDAREHHQIVLSRADDPQHGVGRLDHLALRAPGLDALRAVYHRLRTTHDAAPEPVSHGTTWSVYFRDPEGNRFEVFCETPWHVDQPVRFAIDLDLPEPELRAATEARIRALPGFGPKRPWHDALARRLSG